MSSFTLVCKVLDEDDDTVTDVYRLTGLTSGEAAQMIKKIKDTI